MRKKIVAANWKMNMTQAESARFIESLLLDLGDIIGIDVVIVPPFTAIAKVMEALGNAQNIKVGAQNMHWERSGAFTGEISAALLRDLFVHYVVLGHSERRMLFGETDEIVNRKVRAAHEATLRPIVCIGETLEQRDKGNVEKILSIQLRDGRAGAHSVRRECQTGERARIDEPARYRWRPRRRRQPRSAQLRSNCEGCARRVAQASSLWGTGRLAWLLFSRQARRSESVRWRTRCPSTHSQDGCATSLLNLQVRARLHVIGARL